MPPPPPEKNPELDNICQFGECKQVNVINGGLG